MITTYHAQLLRHCVLFIVSMVLLAACDVTERSMVATSVAVPSPQPTLPQRATTSPVLTAPTPATPTASTVVAATPSSLTPTPDPALATILAHDHIPILCYHAVRDWIATDAVDNRPYIVPVKTFDEHMDYLAQQSYHTITPDQLMAFLTIGTPLPDKPVLLTFDDADATQWTNALPELRKNHFTATFFIMTVVLDHPGYLSSKQVQELDQMGMTIGAHTWDHQRVTRYTGSDWNTQITQPTAQLAKLLNHPIIYFAYPYGLWNTDAITHLKQAGFVAAFQLKDSTLQTDPLFTIRRMIGNGFWTTVRLKQALEIDF